MSSLLLIYYYYYKKQFLRLIIFRIFGIAITLWCFSFDIVFRKYYAVQNNFSKILTRKMQFFCCCCFTNWLIIFIFQCVRLCFEIKFVAIINQLNEWWEEIKNYESRANCDKRQFTFTVYFPSSIFFLAKRKGKKKKKEVTNSNCKRLATLA